MGVIAALLLSMMVLAAQEPAPAIVEGIVLNAASGEPVANILVVVRSPETGRMRTATSGTDGRFRLDDVAPGQNIVTASGRGFIKTSRSGPTTLMLRPEEHRRNVRVQVQPPGVISGRILDENRRPRSGIGIQLLRYGYDQGRKILVPVDTVPSAFTTNDLGDYRLFDLEPGEYLVAAIPSRSAAAGRAQRPPVYYPGVTDLQVAVPIAVAAGAEMGGVDFSLTATTSYAVRIQFSGLPQPAGSLMLRTLPRSGPALHEAFSNRAAGGCAAEGADIRVCNLTPGQYDVLARTLGNTRETSKYASAVVDVTNRNVEVRLTMNSGIAIPGRIAIPENLRERIAPPELGVLLSRIHPGDDWFSSDSDDFGGIQKDGSFQMDAFEGRYYVEIVGLPETIYMESARYAGRNVVESGLTVERNSTATLELAINGPAGRLDGEVRNAKGDAVANAYIALVPVAARRDNPNLYKSTVSDDVGSFAVRGIPPGEYSVLAWEDVDPQALMNRAFVEQFEQRAVRVTIERGDVKMLNVTAIAGR